jgi:predicted nucleic acid-binding protein
MAISESPRPGAWWRHGTRAGKPGSPVIRAVVFPDLLIAAVAGRERVSMLHYDIDFDLIAGVTGQPV